MTTFNQLIITVIDAECGTVVIDKADKRGTALYLNWSCGMNYEQNGCIEREELINPKYDIHKRLVGGERTIWVRFPNKFDDGSGMDPRLSGQRVESRKRSEWEAKQNNGVFYRHGQ